MTRARETSRLQVATNFDGIADEFGLDELDNVTLDFKQAD